MKFIQLGLFFLTLFILEILSQIPQPAYFDVQIDRFEQIMSDPSIIDFGKVKVRKVNKTRSFTGEIVVGAPSGNDIIFGVKIYKKQGNEYRLMPYRLPPTPMCDILKQDDIFYPDMALGSDFPKDLETGCPFQPGVYKVHNATFKFDKVPKMILPTGDYMYEVTWHKKEVLVLKYRVYVMIVQV